MVAEAPQAAKNTLSAPKKPPGRPKGGRQIELSLHTRLRCRNLYLSQGLQPKVIAKDVGLTYRQVQQLATREGWCAARRDQRKRMEARSDAQAQAMEQEVLDHAVSMAGQHVLRGLERTGEALERHDEFAAKDFQSYTAGVKNLVGVIRDVRAPAKETAGSTVNVFVGAFPRAADAVREMKQAEKVEAVTEVSASPVATSTKELR